jgi:DNA-binding LacI/PurR family transcriptional regulator
VPFVGIADAKGARAAAEHLVELGHKKFAILVDRLIPDGTVGIVDAPRVKKAQDAVGRTRVRTYLKTLKDAGIPPSDVDIVEAGGFLVHDTQRAVDVLLTISGVTAVLASTDLLALTLLESCQARGIDVPGDLSLVGYDNLPAARAVGLTTVEQPLVDKGRIAAELLMELLGGGEGRRIVLPTRLEVGRTTSYPGRGLPGL